MTTSNTQSSNATTFEIELVMMFNSLVKKYNNNEGNINYIELRDLERFIESKNIDLVRVNKAINNK